MNNRILQIQNKTTKINSQLVLKHNSVVLFSTETNKQHLHRIILAKPENTRWLGITFRLSHTYIDYHSSKLTPTLIHSNKSLLLANAEQKKNFYKLRGQENKSLDFSYPELDYTISPSDLLEPK